MLKYGKNIVEAVTFEAMKIFRWNFKDVEKPFSCKSKKIVKKISIDCREIAFYPVGHFILSHPVDNIPRTMQRVQQNT